MTKERPEVIVVRREADGGCRLKILRLLLAWPMGILY